VKKLWITFFAVIIVVLAGVNIFYNRLTRDILEDSSKTVIEEIEDSIEQTLEITMRTKKYYNQSISTLLQDDLIEIQQQLPKEASNISSEDLEAMLGETVANDISILVKERNGFIIKASTIEEDVGKYTHGWGLWNDMYLDLYHHGRVIQYPYFGEAGDNFWSAPLYHDEEDKRYIKWGYYKGEGTNYLLSLRAHNQDIDTLSSFINTEQHLNAIIQNKQLIAEVSVVDMRAFEASHLTMIESSDPMLQRLFIPYGSRDVDSKDIKHLKMIFQGVRDNDRIIRKNNDAVLKKRTYRPIFSLDNAPFAVMTTLDYSMQEAYIKEQNFKVMGFTAITFNVALLFTWVAARKINQKELTIFNLQSYQERNNETFLNTIRAYRHDFKNQLLALKGYADQGQLDDFHRYLGQLENEIDETLIMPEDIKLPFLYGLLSSKLEEARVRKISFTYTIRDVSNVDLDVEKTTAIVAILGNLIDNAFRATENKENRRVHLYITEENGELLISVANTGERITIHLLKKIFKPGFTTKKDKKGSGFGLANTQRILDKNNGHIKVLSLESMTTFAIRFPYMKKR